MMTLMNTNATCDATTDCALGGLCPSSKQSLCVHYGAKIYAVVSEGMAPYEIQA
jgi:hypothetical protein